MLISVPGHWIRCRQGLQQGDPISPYLFIIVADVLQKLLSSASALGDICHPIVHTLPCPVLQYANDTLILIKGDVSSVRCPKRLLDDFTLVTGLYINFQKSTFIPLNIDGTDANGSDFRLLHFLAPPTLPRSPLSSQAESV